jgi:ribose transport system permease protein
VSAVTRDPPPTVAGQAMRQIPVSLLVVIGLIVILLVVGTIASPRFASLNNFLNVFQQSAALGFVSLGQTIVVLTGGIDLSLGATISLTSNFASGWIDGDPNMVVPVVVGVVALGAAIGCLNGALSHYLRVHPLIVTLGMASILQGCTLLYSLAPVGKVTDDFEAFAYGRVFGLSYGGLAMLALFALVGLFLHRTRTGNAIYVVGGDPRGARLLGVSVARTMMLAYALSGACAALTAVYLVSRMGSGDPWRGDGFDLASITPVVVGGTALSGGRGGPLGTLLGVFLISLLNNILNFLDVSTFYQWIVQGLIIITAVAIHVEKGNRV